MIHERPQRKQPTIPFLSPLFLVEFQHADGLWSPLGRLSFHSSLVVDILVVHAKKCFWARNLYNRIGFLAQRYSR